jgi:cytochrome b561
MAARAYSPMQQALHWLTALLTAAILPLAWIMAWAADDAPGVEIVYNLHKTAGLLIFGLLVHRLLLRRRRGAPALSGLSAGERLLANATHSLLYLVFLAMCVSGYLSAATSPYPTLFFDLVELPALPQNATVHQAMAVLHVTGQWAVYALLAAHALGVAYHVALRRDGLLERMVPAQQPPP